MVPITSLLIPMLLSAVAVFMASFVIHMLLPYHRSDFAKVPTEDQLASAMRPLAIPPGEYMMPHGGGPEAMKDPVFIEKMKAGPIAILTVLPPGPPTMGKQLAQWFAYCVVVAIFVAYVTGRALGAGAEPANVFRFASTIAFIAHVVGGWQNSIWYRRAWSTSLKNTIDGLVYAAVTGALFTWLWPGI